MQGLCVGKHHISTGYSSGNYFQKHTLISSRKELIYSKGEYRNEHSMYEMIGMIRDKTVAV